MAQKVEIGEKVPTAFLKAVVNRKDDSKVALGKLLDNRPSVVVFIRHFGCIGCSLHMEEFAPRMAEMGQLGLNIIIVGNGGAQFIDGFIERYRLDEKWVTIVTDPSLEIHKAIALKRSYFSMFGLKTIYHMINAFIKGHIQNNIQGDNFQQGGTLLLDEHQRVKFYHRDQNLGDFAKSTNIVDSIYGLMVRKNVLYQ